MSELNHEIFCDLQQQPGSDRTVIIGGGIVGSALAYYLSRDSSSSQVVLIDASQSNPQGSTAFAPGFVGQLNSISHLTKVAKESVEAYSKIPGMRSLSLVLTWLTISRRFSACWGSGNCKYGSRHHGASSSTRACTCRWTPSGNPLVRRCVEACTAFSCSRWTVSSAVFPL